MRLIIALVIALIITTIIGLSGYTFYKNIDLENILKEKEKKIKELDYQNQLLKYEIKNKKDLIERYQKNNKQLFNQIRDLKSKINNRSTIKNISIQPKKNYTNYTKKQNFYKNNQSKKRYKKAKTNYKRYQRYSRYEKLVSDSKIRRRKDGRFVSNSAIYGIYKYRLTGGISCGGNPNIYKIVNECKAYAPYSTDILYFRKSNINDLRTFNPADHKIECLYNQEHGLMQDCKVKIFKYLYK
ncbi:hypothetical protein LCX93_11030 [Sulfurimonas sp. SWIR-19]|uniref:hypothetical protein n=1 Tax=Sulfurimonas sp. SWIR-19 TaxID=2878390 RepID=UPI001CF39BD4|nr:hypothetical protein [Sulfurimonas sp. SWIR-19]UCN00048.1 hypothetical protein LCX93_11030 [Sulfurimonas sp. SWIR-19]